MPRLSRLSGLSALWFKAVTTLLVLVGWLVLSNHCALASLTSNLLPQQDHRCCQSGTGINPDRNAQENDDSSGKPMQCCKALQVATPDAAKLAPSSQTVLAVLPLMFAVLFDASDSEAEAIAFETGPPAEALAFAELVLQQCLLAHAPPLA